MNSKAYILGFLAGIIIASICIVLRIIILKKTSENTHQYDERQAAIRGRGFQLAYFAAICILVLGGLLEMALGIAWCDLFVLAMIALWISICLFTTYCVVKDAYFTLRGHRKLLIAVMGAAGILNLFISLFHILEGSYIIEDSRLSTGFVNLLTGACCLYLAVFMLIWTLHERKLEAEE